MKKTYIIPVQDNNVYTHDDPLGSLRGDYDMKFTSKTEHELFNEICDEIGYESEFTYCKVIGYWDRVCDNSEGQAINRTPDVREIIFTPDFQKKLENYCYDNVSKDLGMLKIMIMSNLKDPVTYLHNIIFPKK